MCRQALSAHRRIRRHEPSAESSKARAAARGKHGGGEGPDDSGGNRRENCRHARSSDFRSPLLWITSPYVRHHPYSSTGCGSWERLEVFKMLLTSSSAALMILAVLGSIVFGLATPSEAAAIGGFGGFILAGVYRFIRLLREGSPARGSRQAVWST